MRRRTFVASSALLVRPLASRVAVVTTEGELRAAVAAGIRELHIPAGCAPIWIRGVLPASDLLLRVI